MNAIHKSVWSMMLLGLAVGCAGETEPEPAPGGMASTPPPALKTAPRPTPPVGSAPDSKPGDMKDSKPGDMKEAKPGDMKDSKPGDMKDSKPGETKKSDAPPPVEGPKAENSKTNSESAKLTAEELAAIKELPAAEQAAAIQQAVCPVSSHHLGSMEKPFKVTAAGRTFFICCEGCEDKVKSDPKGVIAKLDKK